MAEITPTRETSNRSSTRDCSHENSTRQPNMLGTVSAFSQETSLHGVKFALHGCASKPRRLFWGAVLVVQLVLFVVVIVSLLDHVYKYPVLTKVITRYKKALPFPAVTLCGDFDAGENRSLDAHQTGILRNMLTLNKSYFMDMQKEEHETINIVGILRNWFSSAENLVDSCQFGFRDCKNYIKRTWGKVTLCYTINSVLPDELSGSHGNSSQSNQDMIHGLISTTPGAEMGMKLTLNSRRIVTGTKVIVHQPDEKITKTSSEYLHLSAGTENHIGIKVKTNKYLPAPYLAFHDQTCIDTTGDYKHPLVRTGRYTLRACEDACLENYTKQRCGCTLELDGEENICTPLAFIECMYAEFAPDFQAVQNSSSGNPYDCDCPFPCEDVEYHTTLSSGPANKDNTIHVNIYFDSLRIVSTEQVEDYTTADVFASLGGQMGLFLGASIITLIEVVELLARCAYRELTSRYNSVSSLRNGRIQ